VRVLGDPLRQLPKEIVGDESPLLGRHSRLGSKGVKCAQRPFAHGGAIDREHLCDLVVAAAALQHKLEHGALVRRQAVQ
jgi:hypothetical protein